MIVTLGLTLGFGKSDNLAAAYGIAVSADHADDQHPALHRHARNLELAPAAAGAVAAGFVIVDGSFFAANMAKVLEGGYVPLLLAAIVYGIMWIWHRGAGAVHARVVADLTPIRAFLDLLIPDASPGYLARRYS